MAVVEPNTAVAFVRAGADLHMKVLLLSRRAWNFSVGLTLVMIAGIATASDTVPVPAQDAGGKAGQAKDLNVVAAKQRVELTVRVLEGAMNEVMSLSGIKTLLPGLDLTSGVCLNAVRYAPVDSGIVYYPPQLPACVYEFRCLFNEKQFTLTWSAMEQKEEFKRASLPNITVQSGMEAVFDLPVALSGEQLKVTPTIDPDDGRVIKITILSPRLNPGKLPSLAYSSVSIWDGQTLMVSVKPADKADASHFIFVSARVVDASGGRVKQ